MRKGAEEDYPMTKQGRRPQGIHDEKWTICHILRGLVPKALATEWARVFKEMPKSVVEHVSRLFCRFVEEGREKDMEIALRENSRMGKAVWHQRDGSTSPRRIGRGFSGNKYMDANPERTNACVGGYWRSTRPIDALASRTTHKQPIMR